MTVQCLPLGPLGANCYLVGKPGSGQRVVIDPGGEPQRLMAALGGDGIAAVLLTHGHFDHMAALEEINAPVYLHEQDVPLLSDPFKNASALMGLAVCVNAPVTPVTEGQTVTAAGMTFTCLHTPGHTPGSACWQWEDHLFTGDTLFLNGYGRTDLYGGDTALLRRSLQRLMTLNGPFHPGHGEGGLIPHREANHR